jgi:predicted N-acetyltransferase YhbS
MAEDWTIRPGRLADVPSILELFEATFGKPRTEDAYRWKFLDSPWPLDAPPAFVAAVADRVVGHIAGTAFRIRIGGRERRAIHACDSMVAVGLRGRGIMKELTLTAHRAWADGGASLVLALPTQNWVKLNRRVDYRATFDLGWHWRPLWRSLERRRPRGVEVAAVDEPGRELDALWEAVGPHYDALLVRDRAWVAYRYAAAPGVTYRVLLARAGARPVGYLVYRVLSAGGRTTGWIADLFNAPDDRTARTALVRAAVAELRAAGAADARIYAARGTALARGLARAGFVPRKGAYDVRVAPLAADVPWDAVSDPRRFFVMGGDFDVL